MRFDRELGPRRPTLRGVIAGIAILGISSTGTGLGWIRRAALIFVARGTRVKWGVLSRRMIRSPENQDERECPVALVFIAWRADVRLVSCIALIFVAGRARVHRISHVALVSITRRARIGRVSRVAWVSVTWRARIGGISRMAWVCIARLSIARRCVTRISVSRRPIGRISVAVPVGGVTVISAGRRWRCSRDPTKYPGRPSNSRAEGGSWPTPCRCPNRRTGGRSPKTTGKAALDGIIGVGAGREAQRQSGDHARRNSGQFPLPWPVNSADLTEDNGYIAPFLSRKPQLCFREPKGLAAVSVENSSAEPLRGDLVETMKTSFEPETAHQRAAE